MVTKFRNLISRTILKTKQFWVHYFGSTNYSKFIILARSRTGSNLLVSFLRSHPEIEIHGEEFRNIGDQNCNKIWDKIFGKKCKHIKRVGFKIFYYHPIGSDDTTVWDLLEKDHSIKVIHLTRRNKLRTLVSARIASKTDQWVNKGGESVNAIADKRIEIDFEECVSELEKTSAWEREGAERFKSHKVLDIVYENLVEDNREEMNNVFDFLGVHTVPVKTFLKKQNTESLKDLISNFDDLKSYLLKTNWSGFLEEDDL